MSNTRLNRKQKEQKTRRHAGGMPAGHVTQKTLDKQAAREALRAIVFEEMRAMTQAQISNAKGIRYLVVRQKSTGKFVRRVGATDPQTHDPDTEIIEVWEKDPSTPAYTDLMNRTIDKPAEQVQEVEHSGTIVLKHEL